MNRSELIEKIDLLIDQGNIVWESPCRNADKAIALFCSEVKGLVHEIHGAGHPYLQSEAADGDKQKDALGKGMKVLRAIREEVASSSHGH